MRNFNRQQKVWKRKSPLVGVSPATSGNEEMNTVSSRKVNVEIDSDVGTRVLDTCAGSHSLGGSLEKLTGLQGRIDLNLEVGETSSRAHLDKSKSDLQEPQFSLEPGEGKAINSSCKGLDFDLNKKLQSVSLASSQSGTLPINSTLIRVMPEEDEGMIGIFNDLDPADVHPVSDGDDEDSDDEVIEDNSECLRSFNLQEYKHNNDNCSWFQDLGVDNLEDGNLIKLLNGLNMNFGKNGKPAKKVNYGDATVAGEFSANNE